MYPEKRLFIRLLGSFRLISLIFMASTTLTDRKQFVLLLAVERSQIRISILKSRRVEGRPSCQKCVPTILVNAFNLDKNCMNIKFSSYGCISTSLDFFAFARGCGTRPKIRYFGPPQACTRDETPCGSKLSADAFGLFLNMPKGHVKHIKQIPKKNILHSILLPDRILPLGGP